jgi:hypothetical protein
MIYATQRGGQRFFLAIKQALRCLSIALSLSHLMTTPAGTVILNSAGLSNANALTETQLDACNIIA